MPERVNLLTDWVTVARSGATADGRTIEPADLCEVAKIYDPAVYTAVVNVEHYYGNLGTVRELRAVEGRESVELQARIAPNKYYLARVAESSGIFFSVEIMPNFAGSGKKYMVGLASTDTPASLGTTEMHFALDRNGAKSIASIPLKSELKPVSQSGENSSFADTVKGALAEFFNVNKPQRKDENMDEKKLAELFGAAIQPLKDELGKLAKLRASKPEESEDFKSLKGDYEKLSGDFTSIKADYESLKNDVEAYKKKLDESLADNTRSHIEPDTGDNKDKNEDLI